jgi:WD40 repeat protein
MIGPGGNGGFSVFDLTIGQRVAHLLHPGGVPEFFAFDAPSGRLAFPSEGRLWIYDTQGGQERRRYRAPVGAEWRDLDDARRFASLARGSEVFVVDTETASEVGRMETPASPLRITVNADGSRAATFDMSGTLAMWDLRSSRQIWKKEGLPVEVYDDDDDENVSNVKGLEFSEDGQQVRLSARQRGDTWDAATGKGVSQPFLEPRAARGAGERVLEGRWSLATDDDRRIVRVQDAGGASVSHLRHDAKVSVFRFSLDGRSVVTASEDGLVRVWLWRPDDLLERACQVVSRGELTDEEWQDAFGSGPRRTTCPAKTP